jgi:ribonuclease P protein component
MSARAESLPRAGIIRRRAVFDTARNKGRRVSSRHFILNFIARDALASGETGSVAFLTPKRLGPATVRNKLRRRMREIYRRELARPDEKSYLIWIARPPAVELGFEELKKAMRDLAKRT